MKTVAIKTPTAELLIVELAEYCEYSLYDDMLYLWNDNTDKHKRYKGSFTLLGKPDEISEEDAMELVEAPEPYWEDNKNQKVIGNAKWSYAKSLLSLIESEIYWDVNPIPTPEIQGGYDEFGNFHGGYDDNWISAFEEAEQKTFDRKRTLIFKKN